MADENQASVKNGGMPILTFLLTVFPAPGIAKIIKTEEVSVHGKQALD
ncbi:MAG TPA: hypothetical protein PLO57_08630 [Candidatus Cloacimonadota bacterium]|nr:hypothetical protein [Candidatus Cloacimonadota bacterium]